MAISRGHFLLLFALSLVREGIEDVGEYLHSLFGVSLALLRDSRSSPLWYRHLSAPILSMLSAILKAFLVGVPLNIMCSIVGNALVESSPSALPRSQIPWNADILGFYQALSVIVFLVSAYFLQAMFSLTVTTESPAACNTLLSYPAPRGDRWGASFESPFFRFWLPSVNFVLVLVAPVDGVLAPYGLVSQLRRGLERGNTSPEEGKRRSLYAADGFDDLFADRISVFLAELLWSLWK